MIRYTHPDGTIVDVRSCRQCPLSHYSREPIMGWFCQVSGGYGGSDSIQVECPLRRGVLTLEWAESEDK